MNAMREQQVSSMAHRIGLRLMQPADEQDSTLYRLVETYSMQPVYPGGAEAGVGLDELEDWLRFPWE
jgi:hypothetical protein